MANRHLEEALRKAFREPQKEPPTVEVPRKLLANLALNSQILLEEWVWKGNSSDAGGLEYNRIQRDVEKTYRLLGAGEEA
jgi:hypothetical protein